MSTRLRKRYGHMSPMAMAPIDGFEFRFYSSDRGEPPHVHVYKSGHKVKFWLGPPVALAEPARGFKRQEVRRARKIIEDRRAEIAQKWRDFFGT
jgi:Domain of unknown function (DUF4160)